MTDREVRALEPGDIIQHDQFPTLTGTVVKVSYIALYYITDPAGKIQAATHSGFCRWHKKESPHDPAA